MEDMDKDPFIVGFAERQQAERDALSTLVGQRLILGTNLSAIHISFATRMKAAACKLFRYAGMQDPGWYGAHPEMWDIPLPGFGKSPNEIWAEFDAKLRHINRDVWIGNALDDHPRPSADVLLIDDVRYAYEVAAIRERGGALVKVVRPGAAGDSDDGDSTLAGIPDREWDHVVIDDGSIGALKKKADVLAQWIARKVKPEGGETDEEEMLAALAMYPE